jgi:hypothetical protein
MSKLQAIDPSVKYTFGISNYIPVFRYSPFHHARSFDFPPFSESFLVVSSSFLKFVARSLACLLDVPLEIAKMSINLHFRALKEILLVPLFPVRQIDRPALIYGLCATTCVYLLRAEILRDTAHGFSALRRLGASYLLDRTGERHLVNSSQLRRSFADARLMPSRKFENHSHAAAATTRAQAVDFIDTFASDQGLPVYSVQTSSNDDNQNRSGYRSYFWAKDVKLAARDDAVPSPSLIAMIDVDYYLDVPAYLADHFEPTIFFTFQPRLVADTFHNAMYWFEKNNKLCMRVSGGAEYSHFVWNYQVDTVMVVKVRLRVVVSVSIYNVERKTVDKHKDLILFVPLRKWTFPLCYLALCFIDCERLDIMKPVRLCTVGEDLVYFTQITCISDDKEARTSIGLAGQYVQADLPLRVLNYLISLSSISKTMLTLGQVKAYLDKLPESDLVDDANKLAGQAAVLTRYVRALDPNPREPYVFPVREAVRRYQFVDNAHDFDEAAKPCGHAFMSPFIHAGYAPDKTLGNEKRSIQARLENVRGDAEVTPFLSRCINEFIQFVLPIEHLLSPVSLEAVQDKQSKPSQRRIIDDAELRPHDYSNLVKTFQKDERYGKIADPRNITTFDGPVKVQYSQCIISVTDHLNEIRDNVPWRAASLTPRETAQAVASVAERHDSILLSDISRMDGRLCEVARVLERRFLLRAFKVEHHASVLFLHAHQFNNLGRGAFGTYYEQGFSRGSGSPETEVFNSLFSAFTAYFAKRLTRLSPNVSYHTLGLYLGDDGFSPGLTLEQGQRAAKLVGMVMTGNVVYRSNLDNIKFLARIYSPNIWYGDLSSMCDLKRQLSKFHTSCRLPSEYAPQPNNVSCVDILVEKSRSYFLSDANTPIIGPFVSKVVLLAEGRKERPDLVDVTPWHTRVSVADQYPNDFGDWMLDVLHETLLIGTIECFSQFLSEAVDLDCLLSPPLLEEPSEPDRPDAIVHFEGDLLLPDKHVDAAKGNKQKNSRDRSKTGNKSKSRENKRGSASKEGKSKKKDENFPRKREKPQKSGRDDSGNKRRKK